ncbi:MULTISPECIES: helix-turn-helix domain-containing protein [Geobacillus]|jgi:raffinose/stachyose/melibiose transport system permease protein|uniref:Sugar ABC transporter (Permease) n=1 Tax=Geobacillus thermodenitrificans (strain NG80-2) TaxID=420246 RepID=A4ITD0_GEOTN|nr:MULTISPECIES: helix-turn-helix domain-containing protein [Geobacillus]ABO68584.1 Sugar ABC transporter (permease) [Geobacillus thermodenitrificans NG80-2]ATO37687.1 sugar ABC transporter permease [Geobacillus thermodenitrificans]OQP08522.1 sugar ABC transporter permease [Geobacillus sp. 47C-IIb]PTR46270.1 sugar ABC transporter permease [Geobacillus thermodenitrificans]QNU32732.1 helix-turn-helix domain-containing protein [Geobacillus sp. 47C-IIb]
MKINKKTTMGIWLGILPALLIYTVFAILPILQSFYYSLMKWNGISEMTFVGLDNFVELLKDPDFWNSVKNNILVVLASVFGQVPIALLIAILLNRKLKGSRLFRTIGFLPVVLSTVVISITWNLVYNSKYGLINEFLRSIGLDFLTQNWLGDPDLALYSVLVVIVWQFVGLYLIIFLAALQNIPNEVLESAKIDGASEWVTTWKITIPMIWDTILVAIVLCISGSLKTFDLILQKMFEEDLVTIIEKLGLDHEETNDWLIERALEYIRQFYREPIKASEVANVVNISANYFSTIFRQKTGKTFNEYVNLLRVNEARKLLSETSLRVGVIANNVGFHEYKYFVEVFKKFTGMTPTEYRNLYNRELGG